jgi:hypothetical protein
MATICLVRPALSPLSDVQRWQDPLRVPPNFPPTPRVARDPVAAPRSLASVGRPTMARDPVAAVLRVARDPVAAPKFLATLNVSAPKSLANVGRPTLARDPVAAPRSLATLRVIGALSHSGNGNRGTEAWLPPRGIAPSPSQIIRTRPRMALRGGHPQSQVLCRQSPDAGGWLPESAAVPIRLTAAPYDDIQIVRRLPAAEENGPLYQRGGPGGRWTGSTGRADWQLLTVDCQLQVSCQLPAAVRPGIQSREYRWTRSKLTSHGLIRPTMIFRQTM